MQRHQVGNCLEVSTEQHHPSSINCEPVNLASPHDHSGSMAFCDITRAVPTHSRLAKLTAIAFLVNDPDRLDPRVALRATKRPLYPQVMAYSTPRLRFVASLDGLLSKGELGRHGADGR